MAEGFVVFFLMIAGGAAAATLIVMAIMMPWHVYKIRLQVEQMAEDSRRTRLALEKLTITQE